MKYLLQNISNFQRKINEGATQFQGQDYAFFNFVLGYLLAKTQDFYQLFNCLESAWSLVDKKVLPQLQFFQFLSFLYNNPKRLVECAKFIQNVHSKNQDAGFNLIQEMQQLFVSQQYRPKKKINQQSRNNSMDTVVLGTLQMDDNQNFQHAQSSFKGSGGTQQMSSSQNRPRNQMRQGYQYDIDMIKNMEQDERMARLLQQQQDIAQRKPLTDQQQLCEICYVDLYEGQFSLLDKCTHIFHQNCLIQAFKAQISENNFPLRCPDQECKVEVIESNIQQILPVELYTKYQEHTLKAYADLHGDTVSWCPTANCNYMFFHEKGDDIRFECLECKLQYCLNCRCQWHKDMSCKQYQISSTMSEDDKKFFDFVKGAKFKQCPKCKFWVQKNEGCDHMTCKCKFQFCYKCGGVYMKCQCMQKMRIQQQQRRRQNLLRRQRKEQKKKQVVASKRQNPRTRQQRQLTRQQQKRVNQQQKQAPRRGRRGDRI